MTPTCLAVDCMGGDHGPASTMPACRAFLDHHPEARLVLVGSAEVLAQAKGWPRCTLVQATQVVLMDDPIEAALRHKRDSSMRVAISKLKSVDGQPPVAQACVSAGNTGALMAVARYVLKTMEGIERPAIAYAMPNQADGTTTVLDLGANVDCTAEHLLQFAVMGAALAAAMQGEADPHEPTVGLLNIGEEVIKGGETIRRAGELLRAAQAAGHVNFIGNVEGNDIYKGSCDVVVCDGFVGNVMLKTSEGLATMITEFIRQEFGRGPLSKLSALVALPVLKRFKAGSTLGATTALPCWGCADWCSRAMAPQTRWPSNMRCAARMMQRARAARSCARSHRADHAIDSRSGRRPNTRGPGPTSRMNPSPAKHSRITGTGSYLPRNRVSNNDLAARLAASGIETSDDWIVERTGIKARYFVDPGEQTSDLAVTAARHALESAGRRPEEIDLIIVATSTPDMIFPSTACIVQRKLGMHGGAALDVQAVCTGFVYALAMADSMIRTGLATKALVIGAEVFSRILDFKDRTTCVLFGDGAGAVVLEGSDTPGVLWPANCTRTVGMSTSCVCRAMLPAAP
jgi:glycerol-3-phosphate acyltransferase PlsX